MADGDELFAIQDPMVGNTACNWTGTTGTDEDRTAPWEPKFANRSNTFEADRNLGREVWMDWEASYSCWFHWLASKSQRFGRNLCEAFFGMSQWFCRTNGKCSGKNNAALAWSWWCRACIAQKLATYLVPETLKMLRGKLYLCDISEKCVCACVNRKYVMDSL